MGRCNIDRRTLLFASFASALPAAPPRLETLSDWLRAGREARKSGLQSCIERIRSEDPSIHAWVQVLPRKPAGNGKLSGIPFGAKDIMETRGLATEYGSPVYRGRIGTVDAAIVRELRLRGAALLGKTVTAAFAFQDPGPTRNPRNVEHTPGGSSSGSAAAVAAGMGAPRPGDADRRVGIAAGFFLRRDGIQGQLRSLVAGRRPASRQEP